MKRNAAFAAALLAALAAVTVAFGAGTAGADPGNGQGATVYHDFGCYTFSADYGAISSHPTVSEDGKNGVTNVSCHFSKSDMLWGPPDHVERSTGWTCWTDYGPTNDTYALVTPSGEAFINCKVHH